MNRFITIRNGRLSLVLHLCYTHRITLINVPLAFFTIPATPPDSIACTPLRKKPKLRSLQDFGIEPTTISYDDQRTLSTPLFRIQTVSIDWWPLEICLSLHSHLCGTRPAVAVQYIQPSAIWY
jgi:hypothetical protein